jgi:hypothetical protein
MSNALDALAVPRAAWRGYGQIIVLNPLISREDIDAMHRGFVALALSLKSTNSFLVNMTEEMAAEFYGAALAALDSRKGRRG